MQNQQQNEPAPAANAPGAAPAPADEWHCAVCGQEADPIYTVDNTRLCERCRDRRLVGQRHRKKPTA